MAKKRVHFGPAEEQKGEPKDTKKAKIDFTVRTSDEDFDPKSLSESSSEDDGFGDCVPISRLPSGPFYSHKEKRPSKLVNPNVVTARVFRSDSDEDDRETLISELKCSLGQC